MDAAERGVGGEKKRRKRGGRGKSKSRQKWHKGEQLALQSSFSPMREGREKKKKKRRRRGGKEERGLLGASPFSTPVPIDFFEREEKKKEGNAGVTAPISVRRV